MICARSTFFAFALTAVNSGPSFERSIVPLEVDARAISSSHTNGAGFFADAAAGAPRDVALAIDGLDKVKSWSVELLCYELEKYNGFGYRAHGINSPYLWSYSNQYHAGKFVSDGVWSATAVSGQAGAMPIFKSLCTLDKTISFRATPAPHAATEPHELTLGDIVHDAEALAISETRFALRRVGEGHHFFDANVFHPRRVHARLERQGR